MIFNEHLPLNHAFPFEEMKKRAPGNDHYISDRYQEDAESINNYLKTLAEIDADMIAAGNNTELSSTINNSNSEVNLSGEMRSNNIIVSPSTLYHGFMEENY